MNNQQENLLEAIGGEALQGSGFETEVPTQLVVLTADDLNGLPQEEAQ